MNRPPNRMANPDNRGDPVPETLIEKKPLEENPPEPLPDRDRGIACKWCKVVGRNNVRKTYSNNVRIRFCHSCRREFMTRESIG
jgi:hypothetical protein